MWRFEWKKFGEAILGAVLKITTYFFFKLSELNVTTCKTEKNGSSTAAPAENWYFQAILDACLMIIIQKKIKTELPFFFSFIGISSKVAADGSAVSCFLVCFRVKP